MDLKQVLACVFLLATSIAGEQPPAIPKTVSWKPNGSLKEVHKFTALEAEAPLDVYRRAFAKVPKQGHILCARTSEFDPKAYIGYWTKRVKCTLRNLLSKRSDKKKAKGKPPLLVEGIMAQSDGRISTDVKKMLDWAKSCTFVGEEQYARSLQAGLKFFDGLPDKLGSITARASQLKGGCFGGSMDSDTMNEAAGLLVQSWERDTAEVIKRDLRIWCQLNYENSGEILFAEGSVDVIEGDVAEHIRRWASNEQKMEPQKFIDDWWYRWFQSEGQRMALEELMQVFSEETCPAANHTEVET